MNEFFSHYAEIMSDPAHMAAEITFMILIDVLFIGLTVPLIKRMIKRHDAKEHAKPEEKAGLFLPRFTVDKFEEGEVELLEGGRPTGKFVRYGMPLANNKDNTFDDCKIWDPEKVLDGTIVRTLKQLNTCETCAYTRDTLDRFWFPSSQGSGFRMWICPKCRGDNFASEPELAAALPDKFAEVMSANRAFREWVDEPFS